MPLSAVLVIICVRTLPSPSVGAWGRLSLVSTETLAAGFGSLSPEAGFRCGLLEDRDLFHRPVFLHLFYQPQACYFPVTPALLFQEALTKLSCAGKPHWGAFISSCGLKAGWISGGLTCNTHSHGSFEASFRLSFSCFPGTMETFPEQLGDFMKTLGPTGRQGFQSS